MVEHLMVEHLTAKSARFEMIADQELRVCGLEVVFPSGENMMFARARLWTGQGADAVEARIMEWHAGLDPLLKVCARNNVTVEVTGAPAISVKLSVESIENGKR